MYFTIKFIKFLIFFKLILLSFNLYGYNLFETDEYEIEFISNDILEEKTKRVEEIKIISLNNIFERILIKEDYNYRKKYLEKDLINSFIKNIIFNEEKIIDNYYFSKIKINFNKNKIISYLRNNNVAYVDYLPSSFLTLIYDGNNLDSSIFSKKNNYYEYLVLNKDYQSFFKLPNLDVNDRYILNYNDIINSNTENVRAFLNKYNSLNLIFISSRQNNFEILYEIRYFYNNKFIEIDKFIMNKKDYELLFNKIKEVSLNEWKKYNSIQNEYLNYINCNINYFNLLELKTLREKLLNISIVNYINLKRISFNSNNYDIYFYGNKDILKNLLKINEINFEHSNNGCFIYLK